MTATPPSSPNSPAPSWAHSPDTHANSSSVSTPAHATYPASHADTGTRPLDSDTHPNHPLPPPLPTLTGLAGWLNFDPLSPFIAVLPLMFAPALLNTPIPALLVCTASIPLMVLIHPARGLIAAAFILLFCGILTLSMTHAIPLEKVEPSPELFHLWGSPITVNQLFFGSKLGAKVGAILSLAIVTGLLATPQDMLRAVVQHLRIPYRIPYAGIAAVSFVQQFREQHRIIQEAHALRGSRWHLPLIATPLRWVTSLPALTASAVRHAERVSMSMDSRAFAAYRKRTEPRILRWRWRDTLLVVTCWTLAATILYFFSSAGVTVHDASSEWIGGLQ